MSEAEALEDWSDEGEVDLFLDPFESGPMVEIKAKAKPKRSKIKEVRGQQVMMLCYCGQRYMARRADLKRGWALSCSKRCAAIRREFGRPAAKRVEG